MFELCKARKLLENEINKMFNISEFILGDKMSIEEAYKVLQKAWVELYNVEVGDIFKIVRSAKRYELGCNTDILPEKDEMVGKQFEIQSINKSYIALGGWNFPFFVLEFVKKAEPKIEITVKINGKTSKLSDLSEETLLNIRNKT